MLEFFQNYGGFIINGLVLLAIIAYVVVKQPKRVQEWLIWACAQAELSLGGGTGMLKLRKVYDMFITKFPVFSRFISFTTFQIWTEDALDKFKDWLSNNSNLNAQATFGKH